MTKYRGCQDRMAPRVTRLMHEHWDYEEKDEIVIRVWMWVMGCGFSECPSTRRKKGERDATNRQGYGKSLFAKKLDREEKVNK